MINRFHLLFIITVSLALPLIDASASILVSDRGPSTSLYLLNTEDLSSERLGAVAVMELDPVTNAQVFTDLQIYEIEFDSNGNLYAITSDKIYRITLQPVGTLNNIYVAEEIGPHNIPRTGVSLAYDHTNKIMYAAGTDYTYGIDGSHFLYSINLETGNSTRLAETGYPILELVFHDTNGDGVNELLGTTSEVYLAYDDLIDDLIPADSGTHLIDLNISLIGTGDKIGSVIGPVRYEGQYFAISSLLLGLYTGTDGELYGGINFSLVRVDPLTAVITLVREDFDIDLSGAASLSDFQGVIPAPITPDLSSSDVLPFLSVPIDGDSAIENKFISAIVDHHIPTGTGYNCYNITGCADSAGNLIVLAFDGSEGNAKYGENCPPPGYKQDLVGSPFTFGGAITYLGVSSCGGTAYLNYDGHSGTDFAYSVGRDILAAADGILEVPIEDNVNGSPEKFNTLRIKHTNGLETWYLHAVEGSECEIFKTCPPLPGQQVEVKAGDVIAQVGDTGVPGSPHLHFEVRDSSTDQIIDPFGCVQDVAIVDPLACRGWLWKSIDSVDNLPSDTAETSITNDGGGGTLNIRFLIYLLLILGFRMVNVKPKSISLSYICRNNSHSLRSYQ